MKFISTMLLSVWWGVGAFAVNSLEQQFTCPIDGRRWKQRVESSSSPRGLRLDLRQIGDVVDPPTLPECPKCRFPLFSDQLAEPVIERLRPFVLGADFQMLAPKSPSYCNLAQIQEFLKAPHRYIALSYLRASWQVEDHEAGNRRFLEKAHSHFVEALAEMKPGDRQYVETALLCGEVERRLGQWDHSGKRFRELGADPALKDARMKVIIARQLKLIEVQDSAPKAIDEAEDAPGKDAAAAVDGKRMPGGDAGEPGKGDRMLQLGLPGGVSRPRPPSVLTPAGEADPKPNLLPLPN
jgi:hypothetical protein